MAPRDEPYSDPPEPFEAAERSFDATGDPDEAARGAASADADPDSAGFDASDCEATGSAREQPSAEEGDEESDQLDDLSAVQADNALLDALRGSDPQLPAGGAEDEELHTILLAWRRDIDGEQLPELVDRDHAVATVHAAQAAYTRGRRGRARLLVPVAAAAAVLVVAFGGMGLAARDAQPGEALWGLTQVLYADHARSVEAASSARSDLERAAEALEDGNLQRARGSLAEAAAALNGVSEEGQAAPLRAKHSALQRQVSGNESDTDQGASSTEAEPPAQAASSSEAAASASSTPSEPVEDTSTSTPPDSGSTEPSTPPTSSSSTSSRTGTSGEEPRSDIETGQAREDEGVVDAPDSSGGSEGAGGG